MTLKQYISEMATVENDIASSVSYAHGIASFWWNEKGYYTLVLGDDHYYNEDTCVFEHPRFWGNEELYEGSCNTVELTSIQLYEELAALPGADLNNFYGMNAVFAKHREEDDPND